MTAEASAATSPASSSCTSSSNAMFIAHCAYCCAPTAPADVSLRLLVPTAATASSTVDVTGGTSAAAAASWCKLHTSAVFSRPGTKLPAGQACLLLALAVSMTLLAYVLSRTASCTNPGYAIMPMAPADSAAVYFASTRKSLINSVPAAAATAAAGAAAVEPWTAADVAGTQNAAASSDSVQGAEVEGPFVYVYDFGSLYTEDILKLQPAWSSKQYDTEVFFSRLLQQSEGVVRTRDPDEASLFFVPFYSAWYTLYNFRDWENNMNAAVAKTSELWTEVLGRVQREFPYFNRTRGRDHFAMLTMDHGRCTALTFVDPSLYGDMFFVTYNGDKMVRSDDTDPQRNMQAISYNYGRERNSSLPSIPCYMADRDIVVPPYSKVEAVAPSTTVRDITVALRFAKGQHHGVPIRHHNHEIRREVIETFEPQNIPGWSFGIKVEESSNEDWRHSVFSICPPGHSQWTSRVFKSLELGAIPITFFRDHENPFQDEFDYSAFSINLDPDDIPLLKTVVESVLSTPGKLEELQQQVLAVQNRFMWTKTWDGGVELLLLQRLRKRASYLRHLQCMKPVFGKSSTRQQEHH